MAGVIPRGLNHWLPTDLGIPIGFEKPDITGHQTVRGLWRQKDLAGIQTKTNEFPLKVPVHGVLLYKFTAVG